VLGRLHLGDYIENVVLENVMITVDLIYHKQSEPLSHLYYPDFSLENMICLQTQLIRNGKSVIYDEFEVDFLK